MTDGRLTSLIRRPQTINTCLRALCIYMCLTVDISFIVPVYNAGVYLRDCILSIVSQTGFDGTYEILLVDDGSTDGSAEICRELAVRYPQIRLFEPGHGGVSQARNLALDSMRGRYVAFVDADDMLSPDFAAAMMSASVGRDIVCAPMIHGHRCAWPSSHPAVTRRYDARKAVANMLYQRGGVDCSPCGKLFTREVIGPERFMAGRRYEDLDWSPRVMLRAARGVVTLDAPLYFYRTSESSFIHTVSSSRLDVLDMTENVENYISALGDPLLVRAAAERRFSAAYNMLELFADNDEVSRRCWSIISARRAGVLVDRHVRLKSRMGALLSLAGRRAVTLFLKARATASLSRR